MPIEDIRKLKMRLRAQFRSIREETEPSVREAADIRIAETVRKLWQYRVCRQILVYVSTPVEVDTHRIIKQALADGKRVAVPRCVPDTREMEFYYIESMDELSPGSFGVLEPAADSARLVRDYAHSLCLIPAFAYDFAGYRLGYGKGYYDRFLAGFDGHMIGICYSSCVRRFLPHGRFDRAVQLLVTENYIRRTKGRQEHGGR